MRSLRRERVERTMKVEFSPLHELIRDADELAQGGDCAAAQHMYGLIIEKLEKELDSEPEPNKRKPLASKIRIVEGRQRKMAAGAAIGDELYRVTSDGQSTEPEPEPELEPELEPEPEPELEPEAEQEPAPELEPSIDSAELSRLLGIGKEFAQKIQIFLLKSGCSVQKWAMIDEHVRPRWRRLAAK